MSDKIIDGKKHANEIILNIKNDIIDLQKSNLKKNECNNLSY